MSRLENMPLPPWFLDSEPRTFFFAKAKTPCLARKQSAKDYPSLSREEECLATRKPTLFTLVETSVERPLDSFQQERMSGKKKTLSPSNRKRCPARRKPSLPQQERVSGKKSAVQTRYPITLCKQERESSNQETPPLPQQEKVSGKKSFQQPGDSILRQERVSGKQNHSLSFQQERVSRDKTPPSFRKQGRVSSDHWTPSSEKVCLATRRLSLPQ